MLTQDEHLMIYNALNEAKGYPEVVYSEAAVADLKAENARLVSRVKALERALETLTECETCALTNDENAVCCDNDNNRWQFDETRFAEEVKILKKRG